jgi:hypothetical protein
MLYSNLVLTSSELSPILPQSLKTRMPLTEHPLSFNVLINNELNGVSLKSISLKSFCKVSIVCQVIFHTPAVYPSTQYCNAAGLALNDSIQVTSAILSKYSARFIYKFLGGFPFQYKFLGDTGAN